MSSTVDVADKSIKESDKVDDGYNTNTTRTTTTNTTRPSNKCFIVSLVLRGLLFASTLSAAIVVVTSKQTELILTPFSSVPLPRPAKYNDSPGLVYFVVALWTVAGYSIVSIVITILGSKRCPSKYLLTSIIFFDAIILGILASATGTGGSVAYIGYKGNSHVGWRKVCHVYDKFCKHIAVALGLSLLASILLLILIKLSIISIYKQIH